MSTSDDDLWESLKRSLKPLKETSKKIPQKMTRPKKVVVEQKPDTASILDAPIRPASVTKKVSSKKVSSKKASKKNLSYKKIDLHGMTQTQAFEALSQFLSTHFHIGNRDLIVVTGKGAPQNYDDPNGDEDFLQTPKRGVLRQKVPQWLDTHFSWMIVSYHEAPIKHGGAGALVLRLRASHKV